mmetsp:Transcript_7109/g.13108  ORF Transcript_7109/g.13108 Transcript_7109/m.13108 type:complete len:242 (-) Transcript_7109:1324-2049(-)
MRHRPAGIVLDQQTITMLRLLIFLFLLVELAHKQVEVRHAGGPRLVAAQHPYDLLANLERLVALAELLEQIGSHILRLWPAGVLVQGLLQSLHGLFIITHVRIDLGTRVKGRGGPLVEVQPLGNVAVGASVVAKHDICFDQLHVQSLHTRYRHVIGALRRAFVALAVYEVLDDIVRLVDVQLAVALDDRRLLLDELLRDGPRVLDVALEPALEQKLRQKHLVLQILGPESHRLPHVPNRAV